jgi:hypothetical protein
MLGSGDDQFDDGRADGGEEQKRVDVGRCLLMMPVWRT